MNFTFSLPLWGPWHTQLYLAYALPSHCAAHLEGTYVIHTDNVRELAPHIEDARRHRGLNCRIEYVEINPRSHYFQFSEYGQKVFDNSEVCVFLSPDAVISPTTFTAMQRAIDAGYKTVQTAGINCVADEVPLDMANLGQWAKTHLISTLRGNIWRPGGGEMMYPLTMYFEDGDNFWSHAFYHNPLCAVHDREIKLAGTTSDWILPLAYAPEETAILQGRDSLVVEISPPSKFDRHPRLPIRSAQDIALAVRDKAREHHRRVFRTPIAITGEPTGYAGSLIADTCALLDLLPYNGSDVDYAP